MNSSLAAFLESEVPDWGDDVVARSRFRAFSGQRPDWEDRFRFWRDLILKTASYLRLFVLDSNEVRCKWFLRGGVTPLCINQVLEEMLKNGDLQSMKKYTHIPSSFEWVFSQMRRSIEWLSYQAHSTDSVCTDNLEVKLVVTSLLQERISEIVRDLASNSWSHFCVVTMLKFGNLCGEMESAEVMKSHLLLNKKASVIYLKGDHQIEGLKISLSKECVSNVSEVDKYLLHLYWTFERLQQREDILAKQMKRLKECAVAALKLGDRKTAKRNLQAMKVLEGFKEKTFAFQEKLELTLSLISEAEMTKTVSEALKCGASIMKEQNRTLEEAESCMEEADETMSTLKQTLEQLGSSIADNYDETDLEMELENLELEDAFNNLQISEGKSTIDIGKQKPEIIEKVEASFECQDKNRISKLEPELA